MMPLMLSLPYMITRRKNWNRYLNRISDKIQTGSIISLVRYRTTDLAKHQFHFQLIQRKEDPYLVVEQYECDTVSETYHDYMTVITLCKWLLQLGFKLRIDKERSKMINNGENNEYRGKIKGVPSEN